jgi:hypothetical protein
MRSFSIALVASALFVSSAYCPNGCSGHGSCGANDKCTCYNRPNGDPAWMDHDCSKRTCPKDTAWVDVPTNENTAHASAECANRGLCDRKTGQCKCFPSYDGIACERTLCPNNCFNRGLCLTQKQLAVDAAETYSTPWDATKHVGCKCDAGFRGPDCSLQECPSGPDVMLGESASKGRDCSGRGLCDYSTGLCQCFSGFYGTKCESQTILN